MKIVTTYGTTPSGAGKVTARAGGKQKSTRWDQSKSTDWNHGNAAGEFILKHIGGLSAEGIDAVTHDSNDAGTIHVFRIV